MNSNRINVAEPRLYKLREAAKLVGRSPRWVRERVKAGELDGFYLPQLAVTGQSINAFLAARTAAPTSRQ